MRDTEPIAEEWLMSYSAVAAYINTVVCVLVTPGRWAGLLCCWWTTTPCNGAARVARAWVG